MFLHGFFLGLSFEVLGADPLALDGDGCTPELVAQRSGQILCKEILQVVPLAESWESLGEVDVLEALKRN